MKTVGLTGGIGSGKSTVARILVQLGYAVYIADTEARRLINTDSAIRQKFIRHFGKDIYTSNGTVDKVRMATLIFNQPAALNTVNKIVHPRVMEDFQAWSHQQKSELVFFESAILFESGLNVFFPAVICVTAPLDIRIQRVVKRDLTTPAKVLERIRNQADDTIVCGKADFIIFNDEHHLLIRQVMEITEKLKEYTD